MRTSAVCVCAACFSSENQPCLFELGICMIYSLKKHCSAHVYLTNVCVDQTRHTLVKLLAPFLSTTLPTPAFILSTLDVLSPTRVCAARGSNKISVRPGDFESDSECLLSPVPRIVRWRNAMLLISQNIKTKHSCCSGWKKKKKRIIKQANKRDKTFLCFA